MIKSGVTEDRLPKKFIENGNVVHPAARNRQSELDYLRAIAKCLLPRVCNNENLECKLFFSLGRELLACWVLLPLMDVLANPNWLNSIIITLTNKSRHEATIACREPRDNENVMFLSNFGEKRISSTDAPKSVLDESADFLHDQDQLYLFMQFLKREGAVDILRFYLDVENLNAELLDPKVTTDPVKLSNLQQQSEALLESYQTIMKQNSEQPLKTLAEAQEDVRCALQGKWRHAFQLTPEYFRLIYGNREIRDTAETK